MPGTVPAGHGAGTRRYLPPLSLLLTVACCASSQAAAPASKSPVALPATEVGPAMRPVGLVLNGLPEDRPTLAGDVGGQLVVLRDDLRPLGLLLPPAEKGVVVDGQLFVRLSDIPGLAGRLDDEEALLLLSARPEAFATTHRTRIGDAPALAVSSSLPLAFLGYDVSLARDAGRMRAGAFFDAGASGRWGVAGTTAVVQQGGHRLVRLESSLQRDFPGRRLRLAIGDTITRAGEFNGQVRYGGVRIGTDFALAPDQITYPLPVLSGSAIVPSTVELLAASGRQSHSVGPGRFFIEAPVTISGAGEVVMTLQDATGTVRQVRQRFYSSSRLLRPGLTDYSLEFGALRKHYADRSASYGEAFAALSWRRGLTPALTTATRVEASGSTALAGLALQAVVGRLGEVAIAGAMSRTGIGLGSFWRAQVQRVGRRGSFQASYLSHSNAFVQLGQDRFKLRPQGRHELSASASIAAGSGEFSIGVIDARLRDGSRYRLGNLGYSATFKALYLQAGLRSERIGKTTDVGLFLSLSRPIGKRGSMAVTADKGMLTSSYQQSSGEGAGLGFGLASTRGAGRDSIHGYAIGTSPFGDLELSATKAGRALAVRANARGALVFIGERLIPTARLHDGLALVEVASDQAVGIFQEGRLAPRKAQSGRPVLLTGLQPYAANRIAIRLDDLPLSVTIDEDEVVAVPGFRQAARVSFGSTGPVQAATIALIDEAGHALPPGMEVWLDGLRVGVTGHDGLVFLNDNGTGSTLQVRHAGGQCEAVMPTRRQTVGDEIGGPIRCRRTRMKKVEE